MFNHCALTIRNPFWIDVVNSFLKYNTIDQVEDVLNAPLWFNSELYGENFFIKQWYEKGIIRNIIDLINENGTFYDFDEFKTVFNIYEVPFKIFKGY